MASDPCPNPNANPTLALTLTPQEFTSGLAGVCAVAEANFFSQKRFCLVCTAQGFRYLGNNNNDLYPVLTYLTTYLLDSLNHS